MGFCAFWYCQMIVRQLLQWDSESGNLQRFGFEYGNIAESLARAREILGLPPESPPAAPPPAGPTPPQPG